MKNIKRIHAKMKYDSPETELLDLRTEDVITDSNETEPEFFDADFEAGMITYEEYLQRLEEEENNR